MRRLRIDGLIVIENKHFKDERGFFTEHYNKELFSTFGLPDFIQDNHSRSKPQVIRGLHFQSEGASQGKLVSVIRGKIWDVAVDLRKGSPSYGEYEAIELSDENGLHFWIPQGFAHGFCVLGADDADVMYKVDRPYSAAHDGGIIYNDATLSIPWPIKNPILSSKDLALPKFDSDLIRQIKF